MKSIKLLLASFLFATLMGCSVTSLKCGVDEGSSYVSIQTNTDTIDPRTITQLCNFNQD